MIWEDLDDDGQMLVNITHPTSSELSHYLIPDSIDSVSFVTPGLAYGDSSTIGTLDLEIEDEVTWGVAFYGVNGTVFPFNLNSYWGWYDSLMEGSDMKTFDERPTKVTIDELSFLVHFNGYVNETAGAINNYAEIKVDNYVGNWDVDMIGGRETNLVNKSLALNYFSDVRMADFAFIADGSFTGQEQTVSAETFALETEGAQFAEMIMGGVTYDWGKNTTAPYDVVSYTTPVGTFRQAFESDNGQSATSWAFSTSMYYVTIGFPSWDGYSVFQDPVFVGYTSNIGTTAGPGSEVQFGAFSIDPAVPSSTDFVTVSVDVYSQEEIVWVELLYSTDQVNWATVSMWVEGENTWKGDIEPYADETEVYFKVVVHAASGDYESATGHYIVGQGLVTTPPTTTPPGPGFDLGNEALILLLGGGIVGVIVIVLVMKRRSSASSSYSI